MGLLKKSVAVVASLAGITLLGSIFAPSLCRPRESANRVKCASNLKQIGQAILLYGNENRNAMPDSFATLLRTEDLVTEVFVCPSSNGEKAESVDAFAANPTDERHVSYVYCGDGLTTAAPADAVVAFDRLDDHDEDGVNVLFGDGRVEFLTVSRRHPAAWWARMQAQVAAHDRPVWAERTPPTTRAAR